MPQGYTNDYSSTLSSSYTAGGTTLNVASVTGLPASGLTFYLKVDSEYFVCSSYSGTALTVTGAQQGSAAANHSNAASIIGCWWLPATIDGVRADQSQVGTYANLPASNMKQGDRYKCTDAPYDFVFDGSNWQAFCMGYHVTIPALTTFAWVNQGSATVDTSRGYLFILADTAAGTNARLQTAAAPGAHFTVVCAFQAGAQKINALAGFGMRESSTGKFLFVGWSGFDTNQTAVYPYNSATSVGSSAYLGGVSPSVNAPLVFFKLVYDGTNVTLSYSVSGDVSSQYVQIYQVAATTDFTSAPNQGLVMVDNFGNSLLHMVTILHYAMTTP